MISMDSESYKMRDYGDAASEQRAMVVFSNITHPSRRPLFVLSSILVFRSVFLPSFPPSNNSSISFPANSKADLALDARSFPLDVKSNFEECVRQAIQRDLSGECDWSLIERAVIVCLYVGSDIIPGPVGPSGEVATWILLQVTCYRFGMLI